MKKAIAIILFLITQTGNVFGWEYLSKHYTTKDFHAHALMWNMVQDPLGRMWFANNDGVLRFDGSNWNLYPTPKPVRNLVFDKTGTLFLACEGDIGALVPDKFGVFTYTSFKDQMGKASGATSGEKNVLNVGGEIYFTSGSHVLKVISGDHAIRLDIIETGSISGSFVSGGKLFLNILQRGLGTFTGNTFVPVSGGEILKGKTIVSQIKLGEDLLIATNYDGVFRSTSQGIKPFGSVGKNGLVGIASCGVYMALGTFSNGVDLVDPSLNSIQSLKLPSIEIYALFTDAEKNLWVAHRKGLTQVKLNLPVNYFSEYDQPGTINDLVMYDGKLFAGTNSGLYSMDKNQATPINGFKGECLQLLNTGTALLAAGTNGLFEFKAGSVHPLLTDDIVVQIQKGNRSNKIYAFTPDACFMLEPLASGYRIHKLEGLNDLANSVFEDEGGLLWVGTYYYGLKAYAGKTAKVLSLPEDLKDGKVIIRMVNGKPVFQGRSAVYEKSEATFTASKELTAWIGRATNKQLSFGSGDWITTKEGCFPFEQNNSLKTSFVYAIPGNPSVMCEDGHRIWVAVEDKMYSVAKEAPAQGATLASINLIKNTSGSICFDKNGYDVSQSPEIPFKENNVAIQVGVSSLINSDKNTFRYMIHPLNNVWSEWQDNGRINLSGISPGKYTLELEARSATGVLSEKTTLDFMVLAPWYLTIYAYLLYAILGIALVLIIIRVNNKILITKNRKLELIVKERTRELERNNTELKSEKKKSDDLLLNILPEEVAAELKQTGTSKARQYEHVSVLFTDFVNFTGISQQMSPSELVEEIHRNFTAFDSIIEQHGLEKIKTIGDAYLAVCGLPNESPDHAERVTQAALAIRAFMKNDSKKFEIRIGINSGPLIAGIVGVKKYAFDIWGDTVNTAARMEQNSEAGKINISGATYELIKNKFQCEYRGKIKAKNKGEVDMYFVEGLLG